MHNCEICGKVEIIIIFNPAQTSIYRILDFCLQCFGFRPVCFVTSSLQLDNFQEHFLCKFGPFL